LTTANFHSSPYQFTTFSSALKSFFTTFLFRLMGPFLGLMQDQSGSFGRARGSGLHPMRDSRLPGGQEACELADPCIQFVHPETDRAQLLQLVMSGGQVQILTSEIWDRGNSQLFWSRNRNRR
jgi:hypothetical protein